MKLILINLIFLLSGNCFAANIDDFSEIIDANYFTRSIFTDLPKCADPSLAGQIPATSLCGNSDVGAVSKLFLESTGKTATYLVWKYYRVVHARFSIVAYLAEEPLINPTQPITFKKITRENGWDSIPTLLQVERISKTPGKFVVAELFLAPTRARAPELINKVEEFRFSIP